MEAVAGGIIGEVAKQAPSLAVFAWLVYQFLLHIRTAEERQQVALGATEKHCHESNENIARQMTAALDRIGKVVEENTEAIERMQRVLDERT